MKRSIHLLLIFLAFGSIASAQNVNFKVLEDDPALLKNLLVYFEPFYGEAWGASRANLGYRLGAHWTMNDHLQAELQMQRPYNSFFDFTYGDAVDGLGVHNKESDEFKLSKFVNLVGSFTFAQKEQYRPIKVVLKSSSTSTYTTTTYITPKGTINKKFNLRGGLYRYNSTIVFGDGEGALGAITTADGDVLSLYGANDAEGNEIFYEYNTLNWGVSERVTCLVAGISIQSLKNLRINADGYGNCANSTFMDFYIDVLFAPLPNISDVSYDGVTYNVSEGGINTIETSNLGFRCGYRYQFAKRFLNLGVESELGVRPGMKGKGYYLNFGVMLPLVGFKVPKLAPKA
jgi:hypothetical protein